MQLSFNSRKLTPCLIVFICLIIISAWEFYLFRRHCPSAPVKSPDPLYVEAEGRIVQLSEIQSIQDQFQGSFFFIHTSEETVLPPFYSCSVESTSLLHPNHAVFVFSRKLTVEALSWFSQPNIFIVRFTWDSLFQGVFWYSHNQGKGHPNWVFDLSDAFRFVILEKFGGVYQDLDSVPIKSFSSFGFNNTLASEGCVSLRTPVSSIPDKAPISSYLAGGNDSRSLAQCSQGQFAMPVPGVMVMEKGHPFLRFMIDNFERYYNGKLWGSIGPTALFKAFYTVDRQLVQDVQVANVNAFLPFHMGDILWERKWVPYTEMRAQKLPFEVYAAHFYGKTRAVFCDLIPWDPSDRSSHIFEDVFSRHCPISHSRVHHECYLRALTPFCQRTGS
eukprot:GCRY01005196.1.p1 GENE.GCRY01005196.1~~GCRY01005196.1.p1  ORF type:complete len:388 (+),score=49.46 GCRY01005196.1:311-1474(+)